MARNDAQELPSGWMQTTLGEASEVILGQSPPSSTYNTDGDGLPFYQGKAEFGGLYPTTVKWCSVPKKIAEAGDVLISVRAPVGPTNLCREKSCIGRGLSAVRPLGDMPSLYLLYFLRHIQPDWESKATGTTFSAISGSVLREQSIPLAPLPEQHRIVAEIETQFTRLEAGVAALKRSQANLRRYRASALNAACEGRLVPTESELARQEGRAYEPADVLIERILAERQATWEAENPRKKYKAPKPPDTSDLPELPEGWVWASTEAASQRIVDCLHSTPKFHDSGYACVDSNCIRPGEIVHDRLRYVDEATFVHRNRRMKPLENDVLFSREGALLGIAVRVPANLSICLGQRMMVFRLDRGIEPKYFETALNSPVFRAQYVKHITGTASPHLNIRDIRLLGIPVPPIPEQHRIVAEVERRLSVVQELEKQVEAALRRAERLRQAILKHAFEGKLVPQDPNDEPASALLERIATARQQART